MPRSTEMQSKKKLHAFADKPGMAYATVVYLRGIDLVSKYLHC